uniref:Ribonuclease Z n=1 Tax=Caloglossa beccarii TaxID=131038 RepID=A0A1Z1M8V0_9FLOR|nr:ribonuclease Z [Caloglossa beccarii]ARW62205.1 ribonuclease Z [Caloglossa beccarii]
MKINYFSSKITILKHYNNNFIIQFADLKNFCLFNCCEGFQYFFSSYKHQYKIKNIAKIIITSMHINNLSGLIGLLSSLNLIGRFKSLHIYGPKDLIYYLELNKKYSHTNFNYLIYIHVLSTGLIINDYNYRVYSFIIKNYYSFLVMQQEKFVTFLLSKAKGNGLVPNSFYSKLKIGLIFQLPDGYLLNGSNFTAIYLFGSQISLLLDLYPRRSNTEMVLRSNYILS